MNPQERDLILTVFDRLSRLAGGPKDREAEALIHERMRAVPDAAYNLVEAVAVQEAALKERDAHIRQLEQQLAALPGPQAQGGFAQPAGGSAWGRGGSVPQYAAPPPQYAPPPQQYAQPSPWGQPSAGGGFLRTAAGAAVGVAGGMLLAEGVSHMFGSGHSGSPWGAQPISETTTINNYYDSAPPAAPPAGDAQPSYDTNVSDDGGYGGFDDGGGGGFDDGSF